MDIGPGELLIVLLIVVLLFGPGRIANVGGELGKAIHEFRKGLQKGEPETPSEPSKTDDSSPASHTPTG